MNERTPVIFKASPDGEVTAFFPTLPGDMSPSTCACYSHIGQHSGADVLYAASLRPATPAEYADLWRELTQIGYSLVTRRRFSQADQAAREEALKCR